MDWQPIDSAPKDGPILLFYQGEMIVGYWLLSPDELGGWHEASNDACQFYPTHWMPLPPPPTV